MTKESKSVRNLQQALSMEIGAVHQYLLHAHVLEDWGLTGLAAKMRAEMSEELGHAGAFIDRIMFLGGSPRVEAASAPRRAASLKAMFEADRADERAAIDFYTKSARAAFEEDDIGTRKLFEDVVVDEEGHWEWLGLQLDLLERLGEPNFIMQNMGVAAD